VRPPGRAQSSGTRIRAHCDRAPQRFRAIFAVVRALAGEAESRGAGAAAASAVGIAAQMPTTGDGAAALRGFSSGI
jgi:hypothetical protein